MIKHQALAKVQKNYHITLGKNYHHYNVPYQFIGKQLSAVYDTHVVEIYHHQQRIALHRRSYKKHDFTTSSDHMPAPVAAGDTQADPAGRRSDFKSKA